MDYIILGVTSILTFVNFFLICWFFSSKCRDRDLRKYLKKAGFISSIYEQDGWINDDIWFNFGYDKISELQNAVEFLANEVGYEFEVIEDCKTRLKKKGDD